MIAWREKLLATGIHFLTTLIVAACAAALIFLVWYPDPFQTMIGGTELFVLVVGCDLALGPLLSLVVYDSRKTRLALVTDYSVIGVVQVAALVYGVYILAGSRPVYVAFNTDRLEVVSAFEINDKELAAARDPAYASRPLTGPRLISIVVPEAERNDALFESVAGNETHMRPRFYAPYESKLERIRARAQLVEVLTDKFPARKELIEEAVRDVSIPAERVRWLPVHHAKGFWTALIDNDDGKPVGYINLDPY